MTPAPGDDASSERTPQAKVRRSRRNFSIVWTVPIVAALIAGYLVYDRVTGVGPAITISFKDGTGLRVGRTAIRYRGVQIGEVTGIELSRDMQRVLVQARLQRSAASIAKSGSLFWIVRLGNDIENLSDIGTVITGAYIDVLPGAGQAKSEFAGLESAYDIERGGLKIVLLAKRVGLIRPNQSVYYRGIEVGTVQSSRLTADASAAEIHVLISARYAPLVRSGSRFWNTSGVDMKFGLFKGLEINIESLRSLLSGGIAFATPPARGRPVQEGTTFRLYDAPHQAWLQWSSPIPLAAEK